MYLKGKIEQILENIPRTAVLASNTQHLVVVMYICSEKIYVSSFSTSHICRNVQLVVMYINMLLLLPPPNLLILTTLNCHYHTTRKGVHKQNNIILMNRCFCRQFITLNIHKSEKSFAQNKCQLAFLPHLYICHLNEKKRFYIDSDVKLV